MKPRIRDINQDKKDIEAAVQVLEESKSTITVKAVSELSDIPKNFLYRYVQLQTFPICSKFSIQPNGKKGYRKLEASEYSVDQEEVDEEIHEENSEQSIEEHVKFIKTIASDYLSSKSFTFDDLVNEAEYVLEGYKRSTLNQAFHRLIAEKYIRATNLTSVEWLQRYTTNQEITKAPPAEEPQIDSVETIAEPVDEIVSAQAPLDRKETRVQWPLTNGGCLHVVLPGSFDDLTEDESSEIAEIFELINRSIERRCIKNTKKQQGDKK